MLVSGLLFGQTYQSSFESSRTLLKQKRYSEALQEAQRAVALDSSQWGAYYVAGTALVGLDKQSEAIGTIELALSRAPETAKPIINNAIVACRQVLASKQQAHQATYPPPGISSNAPTPPADPRVSNFNADLMTAREYNRNRNYADAAALMQRRPR